MIRIAVDAMGGDHAPSAIVDGAVAAARHLAVQIALVGQHEAIERALACHPDWQRLGLEVVEAPHMVGMTEAPAAALRRKPRASIRVAADLVGRQEAGALFSAGLAIVGHGRSSARAVRNAIAMAYRFAASDFIQRVAQEIASTPVPNR